MRTEAKTFALFQILATNKQNSHFAITQSTHSLYMANFMAVKVTAINYVVAMPRLSTPHLEMKNLGKAIIRKLLLTG